MGTGEGAPEGSREAEVGDLELWFLPFSSSWKQNGVLTGLIQAELAGKGSL